MTVNVFTQLKEDIDALKEEMETPKEAINIPKEDMDTPKENRRAEWKKGTISSCKLKLP